MSLDSVMLSGFVSDPTAAIAALSIWAPPQKKKIYINNAHLVLQLQGCAGVSYQDYIIVYANILEICILFVGGRV